MEQKQYDIDQLLERRSEINRQLIEIENRLRTKGTQFLQKPHSQDKSTSFLFNFERAMAVYDGVMVGYKFYRRFNGFLNLFRKMKK